MRLFRILGSFLIFYFVVTVIDTMTSLGQWLSRGNDYILIGYYIVLVVLLIAYIIVPLLSYLRKPTIKLYKKAITGDEKAQKKILKQLKAKSDNPKEYIVHYLEDELSKFKKITKSYAMKVSSTVLFSPNSFIDGITILLGNSRMIHELSTMIHVRYTWKDIFNMYFSTLTVASFSGLVEEFDEPVIEALEELVEELGERVGEEAGKAITDSIPIVSIAAKSMSFIIQSSVNYAFIIYNGRKFYYMINDILEDLDDKEILKRSRKDARWSRLDYVKDLTSQVKNKKSKKEKRFFKK